MVSWKSVSPEINAYQIDLSPEDLAICQLLSLTIHANLPESDAKIWHGHPVWFMEGNPIVGYSKQKRGIRLMFWSGASFDEADLNERGKKFMDASIYYRQIEEVNTEKLEKWLVKAADIQWDYKNIVKRKGQLERLK